MRLLRLIPLVGLFFVGACDKDGAVRHASIPPLAYIRYVHAVPDTDSLDFKFIDAIEYSPSYAGMVFRNIGIYQGARAGTRDIKVFRHSPSITTTQEVLVDTTLTLVAGTYYTIAHVGYRLPANGTPAQRLVVITDVFPTQSATQAHLSAINLIVGPGTANQDVFVTADTSVTLVAATPVFANVAPLTRTAFVTRDTGLFAVQTAANATTVRLAQVRADSGVAGRIHPTLLEPHDPVGGYKVPGTTYTAFLFPRSIVGLLPAAFTTPAVVLVVDRQPPRFVPD